MPPPSPKVEPTAKVPGFPTDGLLHEGVLVVGGAPAAKCGKTKADKVTKMVLPRAAFVREARRLDPAAEAEKRVPAGICPACWPGNGIIVKAPKTGRGSAEWLRKNGAKVAEKLAKAGK